MLEPPFRGKDVGGDALPGEREAGPALRALPIGGWLWLPAIGLVLGIGAAAEASVKSFGSLIEREHLAAAADSPGLPHASRSLSLLAVASFQLALCGVLVWLGLRFAQRRRNVPKLMIAVYAFNLIAVGVVYALGRLNLNLGALGLGALMSAAIWVPYFLLSERVQRTFLR